MKKFICIIAVILVVFSISACAASKANGEAAGAPVPMPADGYAYTEAAVAEEAWIEEPAEEMIEEESEASLGGLDAGEFTPSDRKLIYTSNFNFQTKAFEKDYNSIIAAMTEVGGFKASESINGSKPEVYGDPGRYCYLQARIPIDKYEKFLSGIEGVGMLVSKNISTEDVTTTYYDNDARIELYEKHYDKLMGYLDKADKMEDIIVIEQEMTDVLYTLDQLKGTKRHLDDMIEYCTVNIELSEVVEYAEVTTSRATFGERVSDSLSEVFVGIGQFFEGFAVVFIASLPIVLILFAIFAAIFFPVRASAKKKKAKAAKEAEEKAEAGEEK